jgi:hypothetical protein
LADVARRHHFPSLVILDRGSLSDFLASLHPDGKFPLLAHAHFSVKENFLSDPSRGDVIIVPRGIPVFEIVDLFQRCILLLVIDPPDLFELC